MILDQSSGAFQQLPTIMSFDIWTWSGGIFVAPGGRGGVRMIGPDGPMIGIGGGLIA